MSGADQNMVTVSGTSTGSWMSSSPSIANLGVVYMLKAPPGRLPSRVNKNVESAVYAYIQAMRALKKRRLNTADIAKALGLRIEDVDKTLEALKKKGIKVLK